MIVVGILKFMIHASKSFSPVIRQELIPNSSCNVLFDFPKENQVIIELLGHQNTFNLFIVPRNTQVFSLLQQRNVSFYNEV